jgi:hypothetical protein
VSKGLESGAKTVAVPDMPGRKVEESISLGRLIRTGYSAVIGSDVIRASGASSIATFSFIPTWVISSSVCAVSHYFWINDKKFASVTNGLTPWTSSSLNTLSAHHFLRLLAVRELHSGRTFQVTCPGEHFLPLS